MYVPCNKELCYMLIPQLDKVFERPDAGVNIVVKTKELPMASQWTLPFM